MAGEEDMKKNAEVNKVGNNPSSEGLHRRRKLPYSPYSMALGGLLIAATVGYFTYFTKKKQEPSSRDATDAATGGAKPRDINPRK
ncbi:hypothetical protein U1Q18_002913 [Sarracenia purpurea var. burkii]